MVVMVSLEAVNPAPHFACTPVQPQVDDGPCVMYIGDGGSGNYVKMVHNGIEYGDMQLISEAYDILKTVGGFTNEELAAVFDQWNKVGGLHAVLLVVCRVMGSCPP